MPPLWVRQRDGMRQSLCGDNIRQRQKVPIMIPNESIITGKEYEMTDYIMPDPNTASDSGAIQEAIRKAKKSGTDCVVIPKKKTSFTAARRTETSWTIPAPTQTATPSRINPFPDALLISAVCGRGTGCRMLSSGESLRRPKIRSASSQTVSCRSLSVEYAYLLFRSCI